MKKILMFIGFGYLGIGGLLGSIKALSYTYAQFFGLIEMGWSMFSLAGLSFLISYESLDHDFLKDKKQAEKEKKVKETPPPPKKNNFT